MAVATKEKRVDFLSDEFDPLTALYSENVPLPCPDVKPFNNLAEYENVMQRRNAAVRQEANKCQIMVQSGSDSTGIRSKDFATADPLMRTNAEREMLFRQMMQRAAKIKRDRMEFDPLIPDLSEDALIHGAGKTSPPLPDMMLKGKQKSMSQRNVLSRMKEYGNQRKKGPLSLLYRAVEERIRVKVWTRSAKQLRGYCKGYIVAFDRHWNLAMVDVDEVFSKPCLPRTPYPSCKALEVETGEVVIMLNEDEPEEETNGNSMDASQSNSPDEDIDALALRLHMLKQELSEIPSEEESAESGPGLSQSEPENDETDGYVEKDNRFDEKKLLTQSNISEMTVSQGEKHPADIHTKTDKDKSGETRFGLPESESHQKEKVSSNDTRPIDFRGGGDAQTKMCSGAVGPLGGAGDVGRLGEVMGKLQVDESSSSGKGDVIFEECDMEVGGYEEIGAETVGEVCAVDRGVVQSELEKGSSFESKKLEKKSKSRKKHSKSGLEKEQILSVELKDGSVSTKVKKTCKAEKMDSKKKLAEDVTTEKSVSVGADGSLVKTQKKSKMSKKSTSDSSTELSGKDKKEPTAALPLGPGAGDTREHLGEAESSDSIAKIAGLMKIPTKSLSAWKIPKKSSKKSNADPNVENPIGKSSDNIGTTCKSEKSCDKPDEKSEGKTSTGTKTTWKIPKLSKKSDSVSLSEERSEGLSATEINPPKKLTQQGTVKKYFGDTVKKCDAEVVEQASGDSKVVKALKGPVDVVETEEKTQIGEISTIVSERLREVKETSVSVARASKVRPTSDVVGSRVQPESVKKALGPKPRNPRKAKDVPVKQPDPVRERLKLAGELSAAHYLKGRLHERHVNKLFLRGDNVAMVNLL
ncbi:uncharacterized protein LOC135486538 [Lineus longissimus]|uniref:uncharacterized protein LOC135486538 n=1 Tax=Lineus longissimus TaxID=88925 RepID=UPI002B4D94DB